MPNRSLSSSRGVPWLRHAAYLVIVIAGLRAASGFVVQVLVAAVLALALLWPMRHLVRRGVPFGLPMVVVIAGLVVAALALTQPLLSSIETFSNNAPGYLDRLETKLGPLLEVVGIDPDDTRE